MKIHRPSLCNTKIPGEYKVNYKYLCQFFLLAFSPDDDWWKSQVLNLTRGVHLRRHRHLPRHPQPIPSHSQTCGGCKEEMKKSFEKSLSIQIN